MRVSELKFEELIAPASVNNLSSLREDENICFCADRNFKKVDQTALPNTEKKKWSLIFYQSEMSFKITLQCSRG